MLSPYVPETVDQIKPSALAPARSRNCGIEGLYTAYSSASVGLPTNVRWKSASSLGRNWVIMIATGSCS